MSAIEILCIITIFQLLLLAIFLLSYKKGNRTSNTLLSAFLFFNAVYIVNYLFYHSGVLKYSIYPPLYYIGNSTYFLLGPLIYLYTRSLCFSDYKMRVQSYLHFLPFVFLCAGPAFYYHLRLAHIADGSLASAEILSQTFIRLFFAVNYYLLLVYIILTLAALRNYRRDLKKVFSNTEKIDLVWLSIVLVAFMLMWLVDTVNVIINIAFTGAYSRTVINILSGISIFINLSFATAIVFRGLNQPNVFSGLEVEQKYGKLRLSRSEVDQHVKKLEQFLEQEKPYLNPSLTIKDLADSLSIPARQLSQVINDKLKQNFYDLVNSYRITEAIEMFKNPNHDEKTILEILYDVGFNSKSSFNHIFKKKTGETPSVFRRALK